MSGVVCPQCGQSMGNAPKPSVSVVIMASFHAKGKGNGVVKALEGVLGDDFEGPGIR